jgi:glycosyltransferase involved in cell wall biosynthesis
VKVLLFSRYGTLGASSRLRSYQYLPTLKRSGIEITPLPLLDNSYLTGLYAGKRKNIVKIISAYFRRVWGIIQTNRFDLIWVEKELLPWIPSWFEFHLTRQVIPFIVDYDDATFHLYDLNSHYLLRRFLGRKIDQIMRKARLVMAGNRYLAQRAARAGAGWIEIIPTVIDLKRYRVTPVRQRTTFTIGWVGSPTTAGYLKLVEKVLITFCRKHEARVVIIGAGNLNLSAEIPIDFLPWSEESEAESIAEFDVGIMPLPDTPWARGKCGYKLIQYMGCGRPVLASSVSAELGIFQDGESGFLVESESQWVDRLEALYDNRKRAAKMGKKGRETVVKKYSLQVMAPRLTLLLRAAARNT